MGEIKGLMRIILYGEFLMLKDGIDLVFDQMRRKYYNWKHRGVMTRPENFYPLSRRDKEKLSDKKVSDNFYTYYKPLRN